MVTDLHTYIDELQIYKLLIIMLCVVVVGSGGEIKFPYGTALLYWTTADTFEHTALSQLLTSKGWISIRGTIPITIITLSHTVRIISIIAQIILYLDVVIIMIIISSIVIIIIIFYYYYYYYYVLYYY